MLASTSTSSNSDVKPVDLSYEVYETQNVRDPSPVVILHGLFGSKQNWRSMSKALSTRLHRPVWAVDLRNHGASPHSREMTYKAMAADVHHLLSQKGSKQISLIGHSMGGKAAMTFALFHPTYLKDLIIADIAPTRGSISEEFKQYVKVMSDIESRSLKSRKEADNLMKESIPEPEIRAFLLTNLLPITSTTPTTRFRIPLNIIASSIDALGDFPSEPGPGERTWSGKTLFIKGTRSNYINRHNIPAAKQFFENMTLKEIDTGHWVHSERPEVFLDLVTEFLKS